MPSKTILTGVRANSNLHLGNYLGAILPMVKMQKDLQSSDNLFMFIPDLHSFTTPIDHAKLYQNILENVKIYLAAGVDISKPNVFFYRQSHISAHSELTWILSCFTYFGEANKMTQFKDKSRGKGETVSVGLFTYPILQAADILLYNADFIPVGEDQRQHIELTRDLAIRINNRFSENLGSNIFTVPKSWNEQLEFARLQEGVRIRSLKHPATKMSKSVDDPKGTILLTDNPQEAAKKIMSATTDSHSNINWDWEKQPGITNLMQIYSLLSGKDFELTKKIWTGQTGYGDLKRTTAALVEDFLSDFQEKLAKTSDAEAEKILQDGENRAGKIANETLYRMQKVVGLRK